MTAAGFTTYSKGEALRAFGSEPNDVLDGVIHADTTVLYGASGVGKGRLLAELIGAGLTGEMFAGRVWNRPVNRVGVIGTDAGAAKEYAEWIERAGAGAEHDDNVRIWQVEHALTERHWGELNGAILGFQPSLLVIDSTTEVIQGSVIDDLSVREFWRLSAPLRTARIPLVMVHHVAKPGPDSGGRPGSTPMGSTLWETFSRNKVHVTARGGQVVMACRPRHGGAWSAVFDEDPATGRLNHTSSKDERETAEARQARRDDKTDLHRQMAAWIVTDCQGMNNSAIARAAAEKFGVKSETVRRSLTGGRDFAAFMRRDGDRWVAA